MNNIDTIMYLIDWNRSAEEQQKGIEQAREVKCIKTFFQPSGPGYSKSVWENCAHIVCERTDEELIPYTIDMLMWLQDLNWPGARCILNRLMRFSNGTIIAMIIEDMLPALEAMNETSWLISIAYLLNNKKIAEMLGDVSKRSLTKYQSNGFSIN